MRIDQIKRVLARLAVSLALVAPLAAGLAGCGAGTHFVENVVAHKVANHFAKTPGQRRAVDFAFCALSVHQAARDFRTHHAVFGALSAAAAIRNCERGFSKNSP